MQLPGLLAQPVQQQLLGDLRFLGFQGLRCGGMLLVRSEETTWDAVVYYIKYDVHIYIFKHVYSFIHIDLGSTEILK